MRKTIVLTLAAAGTMLAATFTGTITDSGCAQADHKAMNMGSDEQCVKGCMKHGLSDQKTPEQFAAKKVTVDGTLDAKTNTIKVASIKAAQ
jgi:hypothetical protein